LRRESSQFRRNTSFNQAASSRAKQSSGVVVPVRWAAQSTRRSQRHGSSRGAARTPSSLLVAVNASRNRRPPGGSFECRAIAPAPSGSPAAQIEAANATHATPAVTQHISVDRSQVEVELRLASTSSTDPCGVGSCIILVIHARRWMAFIGRSASGARPAAASDPAAILRRAQQYVSQNGSTLGAASCPARASRS